MTGVVTQPNRWILHDMRRGQEVPDTHSSAGLADCLGDISLLLPLYSQPPPDPPATPPFPPGVSSPTIHHLFLLLFFLLLFLFLLLLHRHRSIYISSLTNSQKTETEAPILTLKCTRVSFWMKCLSQCGKSAAV